jgi:hypothetical protein
MNKLLIKILFILWIALTISLATSCTSGQNMTGRERVKKDQKYYNYEAAMKRAKRRN